MNHYLAGCDILGADAPSGAASFDLFSWLKNLGKPKEVVVVPEFGPGAGGTMYTDSATIFAVQEALVAKGYDVGKAGIDGKFGPDTEAALFKFSGKHGPPDDATLDKLGVKPHQGLSKKAVTQMVAPVLQPSVTAPKTFATSDFWARPLWAGSPVKTWHATVGAAVAVAVGMTAIVLRR